MFIVTVSIRRAVDFYQKTYDCDRQHARNTVTVKPPTLNKHVINTWRENNGKDYGDERNSSVINNTFLHLIKYYF